MSQCVDCPDLDNGTRKRAYCCRRALKVGDRIPHIPPKIDIRPAFTGAGSPSFKPARHAKRAPGK